MPTKKKLPIEPANTKRYLQYKTQAISFILLTQKPKDLVKLI